MHARYVEQVLRDRGIPAPAFAQIERFVRSLSEDELPPMEERLRKLALGVEQHGDTEALLRCIQSASVSPESPVPPGGAAPSPGAQAKRDQRREPAPARPHEARSAEDTLPAEMLKTLRQHGMHVYAKSAALKVELGTVRATDPCGEVQYTVQLDAARAKGSGYDWNGKVPFQFTLRELPLLTAYLLGMAGSKLAFANHGPNCDKHFEAEDQGERLFVKVRLSGGPPVALPVPAEEVFGWGELCLIALRLNRPTIGTDGHLALLRRLGRMDASRA